MQLFSAIELWDVIDPCSRKHLLRVWEAEPANDETGSLNLAFAECERWVESPQARLKALVLKGQPLHLAYV